MSNEIREQAPEAGAETDVTTLAGIIECLLFAVGEPLTAKDLAKTTETDEAAVHTAVRLLRDRYSTSGLQIVEIAHGYQMATRPEFAPMVAKLLAPGANRLSRPALETVTIIAYRQPCTQAEIEAIRGVASDGVLKTLTEREMIKEAGRKQTPGRPILYATTDNFLHYFGLSDLSDLPLLDEEEMDAREAEAASDDIAVHTALVAAGVEE
ncbi:MAG: SMC-Scp complex subunit ScpB [Armatimonadota bacterium]